MTTVLQGLGFATPLALFALLALPVIWWLLRFTPPRPRPQAFPPIRILMTLPRQDETPDKTPWWLLLLRLVLAALVIFVVAQPFYQPPGTGGLPPGARLIVLDDGWAAAAKWSERRQALIDVLEDARGAGEDVMVVTTAPTARASELVFQPAAAVLDVARSLKPSPLSSDRMGLLQKLKAADVKKVGSILWLSDGLDSSSAETFAAGLKALAPAASLRVIAPSVDELPLALSPVSFAASEMSVDVLRAEGQGARPSVLSVRATNGRVLTELPVEFGARGAARVKFSLPTALRNEIQSVVLNGEAHAGARQLFDDRWRKRVIALQTSESVEMAQPLLSPLHYVSRGLEPFAELYEPQTSADISNLMDSGLSMLVLADVGFVPEDISEKVSQWVDKGGILVRFAGPRLAAGHDDLLPVKLREGDRELGSALAWETPQGLQAFPEASPFAGLVVDPRVTVSRQVLAEPNVELGGKTWASLTDGTPLVTAEKRGKGLIVLFHVTSNASWSNLPLSGLFLQMLQRVAGLDPAAQVASTAAGAESFSPRLVLTGEGDLVSPDGTARPILPQDFEKAVAAATTPPGLYVRGGEERALNLRLAVADLKPMAATVAGAPVASYAPQVKTSLVPGVVIAALTLFLLDCIATFMIGGGLARLKPAAAAVLIGLSFVPYTDDVRAQDADMQAALQPRLAFVRTGDDEIDRVSEEGLRGLTLIMADRTSANLAQPVGINIETDELVFYPLLYWPIPDAKPELTDAARSKLSIYLKNGGMVLFDLRDGGVDLQGDRNESLKAILNRIDVPPLEPVPEKHVLTRTFYLLDTFPGRFEDGPLWVESSIGDGANPGTADGVSAIIIGANDYASAWALDEQGQPLYALVPGTDRQREFAFRVGINIVMYALTGNYKADQVHVPALLERLGQ